MQLRLRCWRRGKELGHHEGADATAALLERGVVSFTKLRLLSLSFVSASGSVLLEPLPLGALRAPPFEVGKLEIKRV